MTEFKDYISVLESIVTILAIIVGGGWALRRYVFHQEYFPRIDFSVDVNFVGSHKNEWLIEISGLINNKGLVPHQIENLCFELRYLAETDNLSDGNDDIRGQVIFAHKVKEESWIPLAQGRRMIIHPDITLRYNYIYKIPDTAAFVLLHGALDYGKNRASHRADRVIKVPSKNTSATPPH